MTMDLLERLRQRHATCDDPTLKKMLADRIVELSELERDTQPTAEPQPAPEPVREPYEKVLAELERVFVHIRDRVEYGRKFEQRWGDERRIILASRGWTDEQFYAEMDRRRRGS